MKQAWRGDLDAGFILVLQIAAGTVLAFFVMFGIGLVVLAVTGDPGLQISDNAQNLILTLTGGVLSLLSTLTGRYYAKRAIGGK